MTYPPDPEPTTWIDVLAIIVCVLLIVGACAAGIAYLVMR